MVKFLSTSGITHHLDLLISKASERIILLSPYLRPTQQNLERLRTSASRGVELTIVYGKQPDLADDLLGELRQLSNFQFLYYENLHAKCFVTEQGIVLGSMNLYDFSMQNNREMGVYATADETVYKEAILEVEEIMSHAGRAAAGDFRTRARVGGTCIRCGSNVRHSLDAPLCSACFGVWREWSDPNYLERYCHTCGRDADVSYVRPECYSCYKESGAASHLRR